VKKVSDEAAPRTTIASTTTYLKRLEQLARVLIGAHFENGQAIWQLQLDLLQLQSDIQGAISGAKRAGKASRAELEALRQIRWHARLLGDAIAWVVLGMNRQLIEPLGNNDPVPIAVDQHGNTGVINMATHLSSEGWGFPLLHDITDCLRIGDVSFVDVTTTPLSIRTVEMKTGAPEDVLGEDGSPQYRYTITVISTTSGPPERDGSPSPVTVPGKPVPSATGPRVDRQVLRMTNARKHQEVLPNTFVEIDGKPLLSTHFDSTAGSNWPALRKVIREARKNGYGVTLVDDALLYMAIYHPEGFSDEILYKHDIASAVTNSNLLVKGGTRNAVIVNGIPPKEARPANHSLPFYLYSIPQKAILDILNGRLSLIVLVNPAPIISRLEDAGFTSKLAAMPAEMTADIWSVNARVSNKEGEQYEVELHNLHHHIDQVIHEFKSVDYLIEAANSVRESIWIAIDGLRADQ
jgi:hypothetical protein